MQYRLGNSKHVLSLGDTQEQTCPNCEKEAVFPVFKNPSLELTATPPYVNDDPVYFTFCPVCQQCFTIPLAMGTAYEKGDTWAVRSYQFTLPEKQNS